MEEFLKILGGTTLILGALFSFLGKIVIGRILERERNITESSLSKLKNDLDKSSHIGKSQFDYEFKIYQEIWKFLVVLRGTVLGLRPVFDQVDPAESEEEIKSRRIRAFSEAFNSCRDAIEQNKPFYSETVYMSLSAVLKASYKELVGFQYQEKKSMEYWDSAEKNQDELIKLIDDSCSQIRKRFQEVQVV